MKGIFAAVVVAAAVAIGVAHTILAPEVRALINEARRLDWEEHMDDLENRKAFLRYYRMPEETFDKLVQLHAPHLEKKVHMARECVVCIPLFVSSQLLYHNFDQCLVCCDDVDLYSNMGVAL